MAQQPRVALLLLCAISVSASTLYNVTDLGTLGGVRTTSEGFPGINASGQVTGYSYISGNSAQHAFLYSNGVMRDLGTLGGTNSYGEGINASGQVAGFSALASGATHAFLYGNGVMTALGTLGGAGSQGFGINASGQVTGSSDLANGASHAFLYSNGVMTDLGTLGGAGSNGYAVNASAQVTGYSFTSGGVGHPFLYSNGVMTDLGTLGAYGEGRSINASGQVVGSSYLPTVDQNGADRHAFLYSNGVLTDLNSLITPTPGVSLLYADGINDLGQIVGATSNNHAFLYSNGVVTDLNSVITIPGVTFQAATSINNLGQIVAIANGPEIYLLSPITQGVATTTLTSSANPSTLGQSVTLTAMVTPSAATGTVTFKDGSTTLGTATLSGGTATLVLSTLTAGSHSLTAVYSGDTNDAGSTSSVLIETINQPVTQTTTSLTSSANPSILGQSVTLTAKVAPSTATGSVTFRDGTTILSTVALSGGSATLSITSLITGTHSLAATYGGDANDASSVSAPLTQQINRVVSTIGLTSSLNPSTFGMSVTLTATVSPAIATGTVTFLDGITTLGTGTLGGGTAAFTSSSLSVGAHSLSASYAGDGNDSASVSPAVMQTVKQVAPTTILMSSANPSAFGQSVTLTASVSPATATGTITFKDGATTLGMSTLTGGTATFVTAGLAAGTHSITAVYGGDTNDASSASSVLTETVNPPVTQTVTTTSLTSSANPSLFGQSVTLTAKMTPSTATGTVTFKDGSTILGTANLSAGTATFSATGLSQGSHSLTAVYGGDNNDAPSTSPVLTQTVNPPVTVQPRVGGFLTCANSTVVGPYGYAISGLLLAGGGRLTPFADYGSLVADGNGSFTGFSSESTGGTIASRTLSGSYSINANCSGTATFTDSLGNTLHVAVTVVDNGGEIQFIQTDSGTVVSGTAQRAPTGCDASAVSGPYTYAIGGWIAVAGGFEPFADAGRIVSDGKGNLTGKSTYSASGTIGRRTFTGSYAINSNCTGTATLKDSLGNTDTLAITIVNNGQQVLFIETDSGTVVSGGSQRGQFACSTGVLTGPYSYALEGYTIATNGGIVPGADSGLFTSDGSGHFAGSDTISVGGTVVPRTVVAGSYTVNSDCTGSAVFTDTLGETVNLDVFVANGGTHVQFIETDSGTVTSGSAQQNPGGACSNAILNGAYGYAIEGWTVSSNIAPFADSGQVTSDGAGHLSGADSASAGGTIISRVSTGSYQINSDCSGSVSLAGSTGPANLRINVSSDGRQVSFIETDAGTIISGGGQRELAFPSDGIVSAASYTPGAVVPGSLFAIFGNALSPGTATAGALPWPTQLGGTAVLVNGIAAPLYYVSPTQINGQLPLEIQPGPVQLVVSDGLTSAPVAFNVPNAWPGIFTYGLSRAIAVNPDGGLNGPAAPAHAGDILVVYLTGGGPVNPSGGAWITGAAAPPGLSSVTLPFTVTIGGLPTAVDYLGLTPTAVGLYQLNVHVPPLPAGDHTLAVNVGGNVSDSALISVAP